MAKKIHILIPALAATAGVVAYLKKDKIKEALKTERDEIHFSDFEDLDTDVAFADIDGDGKIDAAFVDTTGDGQLDTAFVDLDGNGTVDAAVPVETEKEEA